MEQLMKNLLVIADRQGGKNTALLRAVNLQKELGCSITLIGFCYVNIQGIDDIELAKLSRKELEKKITKRRKQELNDLISKLASKPKEIKIEIQWCKDIVPAIKAFCEKHPFDMVIKSGLRNETLIHTSTDWRLLRECKTPVMITTRRSWKKKPNIIAAIDFSTHTKSKIKLNHSIMTTAQSLAEKLKEQVHVVFALTVPQPLVDMDIINPKTHAREKRKKLQPEIEKFCTQYGIDSDHLHIKSGSPDKVIPSVATRLKSDLVVTGTIGRKGVKGKFMGNTAESILTRLHTDIIAIKP